MKTFLLSLLFFFSFLSFAQAPPSNINFWPYGYYPYVENGKTGWENPGIGQISPSSINRLEFPFVYTDHHVGLVDLKGNLILDTIYTYLDLFNDDFRHEFYSGAAYEKALFKFGLEESKGEGLVTAAGEVLIAPEYSIQSYISPGLIVCRRADPYDGRYLIYSLEKKEFLPAKFDYLHHYFQLRNSQQDVLLAMQSDKPSDDPFGTMNVINQSGEIIHKFNCSLSDVWVWPNEESAEYSSLQEYPLQSVMTSGKGYVFHRGKLIDSVLTVTKSENIDRRYVRRSYPAKNEFPTSAPVNQLQNRHLSVLTKNGTTIYSETGDTLAHYPDQQVVLPGRNCNLQNKSGKYSVPDNGIRAKILCDSLVSYNNNYYRSWRDGKEVIFSDGSFIMLRDVATGKYALADSNFVIRTAFEYDSILRGYRYPAYDDYLVMKNGKTGVIDKNFNLIYPVEFDNVTQYSCGENNKISYHLKKGRENLIIGRKGDTIWKGNFDNIRIVNTSSGKRFIEFFQGDAGGILDPDNRMILKPQPGFSGIYSFHDNNLIVYGTNSGTGVVDYKGKEVLQPKYKDYQPLSEELFLISDEKGAKVFSAGKKEFVTSYFPANGVILEYASEDSVALKTDKYMIILDGSGKIIYTYMNGVYPVADQNGSHLVNKKGKVLTENYAQIEDLRFNTGYTQENRKYYSPASAFTESLKSRYYAMWDKEYSSQSLFDVKTSRLVEGDSSCFFYSAESDTMKGVVLQKMPHEVKLYDADLKLISPLKFDRYDQDSWLIVHNPQLVFENVPLIHLYIGTMRYTYDRRNGKLSGPEETKNKIYDTYGNLVVEDYDSIEQVEQKFYAGNYMFTKVTKGTKTYWLTPERFLYHVSENKN